MEGQKKEKVKLIKVEGVKEWEVEKNFKQKKNKRSSEVLSAIEEVYSRA